MTVLVEGFVSRIGALQFECAFSPACLLSGMHDADGVDGRGNIQMTRDMRNLSR